MNNYNFRPELLLELSNVAAALTFEQKVALQCQWQYELTDLAALARMMPSLAYSARLGLMPAAMALGFKGYGLFIAQIRENRPDLFPENNDNRMELKPELAHKPEYPMPRPHIAKPRLWPEDYPRPYH